MNKKEYQNEWNERNKEHLKNYRRNWYLANRERTLRQQKERWVLNRTSLIIKRKELYQANIEHFRKQKRDWVAKNKEKVNELKRKWYQTNNGAEQKREWNLKNKEKMREVKRAWNLKNREKIRIIAAIKRRENKDKIRERKRLWAKTPQGKIQELRHRMRRKGYHRDLLDKVMLQSIYEDNIKNYGTLTCYLCLKPIEFGKDHLDHKTPLSRGGDSSKNNLGIAHSVCNLKKHNRTEKEYREIISLGKDKFLYEFGSGSVLNDLGNTLARR